LSERIKISFKNKSEEALSALLEMPAKPRGYALFAHCFTCSKNTAAATRISQALAKKGIAVLRFDFTGLGNSEGDFSNTNFSSNVSDLICAANYLKEHYAPVDILIGHSLGGAAVLSAANALDSCRAVATIGAPADPQHISHLFAHHTENITKEGSALVNLGGREFRIKKQFLDDLAQQTQGDRIASLRLALLVLHSPIDEIVDIENAALIFKAAKHPKSFVSLDKADHLLSDIRDSEYASEIISAWAARFLPPQTATTQQPPDSIKPELGEVLVKNRDLSFTNDVLTQDHQLIADEPETAGGANLGPDPYQYLLAGLGACTSMTLRMYATRKEIELKSVAVVLRHSKIHADDCEECETKTGTVDQITRIIKLTGNLTDDQRQRLLEIADRCPVHRTLSSEINIKSQLEE